MDNEQSMIKALSDMLKEGETFMYPIFGTVNQRFAYFAFTETHFLIAYLSGNRIVSTDRIPLEITSIKIKKTKLLNEYIMDILFANKTSLKISAFPKVLKIKSQKERFPLFLKHLKTKAEKQARTLEDIDGAKIRWQYFNTYIYMILNFCFLAVPAMIICTEFKKGNFDVWEVIVGMSGAIPVLVVMYGFFLGPFIILSVFNRFSFGKVLGVVNQTMLFLENREIPLNYIEEIVYHPRVMSKLKMSFSYATFTVRSQNNIDTFEVFHFPIYGLWKIKKHNKNVKLKFDKYIWLLIFYPTIIFSVLGFLLG